MDISKLSEQDLQPLLQEAIANQTKEDWMKKFLENLKKILLETPARYRGFGPYWWSLKKVYVDRGDISFGDFIDLEWQMAMDYGKPELNIMAAFVYEELRTSKNLLDDPFHTMDNIDGSDSVEFASSDPDMEIMALSKTT
jgi:hypothetical protein